VTDPIEERIDALYGGPLESFTPDRDALAKELAAEGDKEGGKRVKALRKPVVSAWALDILAREDPEAIGELLELGDRLRDAQRRAISGGDVEPLREATDERRRLVSELAGKAAAILERSGSASSANGDAVVTTLEAATADEEAGELLRSGRLVKPLRPPTSFDGAEGLRVLEGGRQAAGPAKPDPKAAEAKRLERELRAAEVREKRAEETVERERGRLEELERKRGEHRERVRVAEAEHRGIALETKRLARELDKLRGTNGRSR
jgi:hypothetical protein